jgi:hypothetical protein
MVVQKVIEWVPEDEVHVSYFTSFWYADSKI